MTVNQKITIAISLSATAALTAYITLLKRDLKWTQMIQKTMREIQIENGSLRRTHYRNSHSED